jgi:hypothetical protein
MCGRISLQILYSLGTHHQKGSLLSYAKNLKNVSFKGCQIINRLGPFICLGPALISPSLCGCTSMITVSSSNAMILLYLANEDYLSHQIFKNASGFVYNYTLVT